MDGTPLGRSLSAVLEPETERLRLRQWRADDHEPFAALNADPEVMRHFPAPLTRAQSDAMIERCSTALAERGWGLWAVEVKADGRFVGFVGLNPPTFEAAFTPCVEIGWRLAQHGWGQGFATEAARACLDAAFGPIGLTEVVSFTTRGNDRSRRVMERLGMTRDLADDFDHPRLAPDDPLLPHVLYRLPAPDPANRS